MRVAVLASGRGTNLQALLDAASPSAFEVAGVFSDRAAAQALERARAAGVPAVALDPADCGSRDAFDAALCDAIDAVAPDLVVCAGYLRVLTDAAVAHYAGRIINIHPSLLPRFPGLRTHAQALAAGDRVHGASVHFVIPALDAGPVIAQARVAVRPNDTAASLSARVLEREHPLLVACLRLIAAQRVFQNGSVVLVDSRPLAEPLLLGDDDRLIEPVPAKTP
ncbi:MAG TPA: phosphoribosylglycinamide formyltransferase [Xanthomonadaceae bacterium]|jgi:phosphoribosylglycinamide formyltransferase-1|nr:phosphoribosylglycinamide formyltransferase [Xanthomonadaceae bacterium]